MPKLDDTSGGGSDGVGGNGNSGRGDGGGGGDGHGDEDDDKLLNSDEVGPQSLCSSQPESTSMTAHKPCMFCIAPPSLACCALKVGSDVCRRKLLQKARVSHCLRTFSQQLHQVACGKAS